MASISNDGGGYRRLLFILRGKRHAVRLGKVSAKTSEAIRLRVEAVVAAQATSTALDPETAAWIGRVDDALAAKLAGTGLIPKRASADLETFCLGYIADRDVKEITRVHLRLALKRLVNFLGDRPVAHVSPGDADGFAAWLVRYYARATAGRTIARARQFFRAAVRARLIPHNPFEGVTGPAQTNPARQAFVGREVIAAVLDACPDDRWKRIVALTRFGGLRCPSEVALLTWADVKADRFWVTSPKTARHEGKAGRWVPLFPELRPHLVRTSTLEVVVPGLESATNLRTQFLRIIRHAGVKPWPRLFQNLRASRETELAGTFPIHVAAAWMGNTALVAARHYLTIREEDFMAAQTPAQHPSAGSGTTRQTSTGGAGPAGLLPQDSGACWGVPGWVLAWEGPELPHISTANLTVFDPGGAPGGRTGTEAGPGGMSA